MIMKLLGCRSIRFIRYFSDVQKVTKFKPKASRKINYCTPILSEERKKSINKIVALQISGRYLTCTSFLRDGNMLVDWKMLCFPENMYKFNLNDIYNSVVDIMKDLPQGDAYLIENYMKMPSNVNVAGANLFYIKLQTLAMLIALINSSQMKDLSTNTNEKDSKVVLMKARLHARLFRIIVGTEIISSQTITESMLKGNFPEHITPITPGIDAVLTYNSVQDPAIKELMSNGLMMALTFVNLVLNCNPNSLQALSTSYSKKLKSNKK
ncbi:uncharacterized protein LOC126833502 [Adelges cooleyi]|uniref:uncharacterized protein LOC126833502 n=1 Tax=Adelges cooleyi TaxID=133065 RepID=UPI00217F90AF|nr:uncharacterized protein LOC126833502 [Adelges cooleyi]